MSEWKSGGESRPSRQQRRPSEWKQSRRNFRFWHGTRWLVVRLFVLSMLVTAAVTGYHWYNGASFESALRMMTEDYRLAAACPAEMEAVEPVPKVM